MNKYKLAKAEDGVIWVSIQPLMDDIRDSKTKLFAVDTSRLSKEQKSEFQLRMIGLEAVYEFLGALVTEKQLEELRQERQAQGLDPDTFATPDLVPTTPITRLN